MGSAGWESMSSAHQREGDGGRAGTVRNLYMFSGPFGVRRLAGSFVAPMR